MDGPGLVDVAYWKQKDSLTIHLVNLTNPMAMKGPVREVIPLPAQKVQVTLPDGRTIQSARLLVAGTDLPFQQNARIVRFEVPSVGVHEVIGLS